MNAPEGLDIRAPIGGLFTLLGLMLAGYGLVGAARAASGTNVNLWWGIVMVVFGVIMLFLARRSMSAPPSNG
jgi:FtsH-binding integral membrane protein